jgi:hypothetical protein
MSTHQPQTPSGEYRLGGAAAGSLRTALLAAGIALLALSGLALMGESTRRHFQFAWLVSFGFYFTISVGGLFFVLIHHLVAARWSVVVRRLAETLAMNLPLMLLLFIPIVFWIPQVYAWADPVALEGHAFHGGKAVWLSAPFFVARTLVYFAIFIGLARWLYGRSIRQDSTGDPGAIAALRRGSAPGTLAFALTLTFASFDWFMSLEPHWYSTIYGVYVFAGSVVAIYATLILVCLGLSGVRGLGQAVNVEHYHDMGKMLFGFVVFWTYIAFSQFLLIWMANIPEETEYFAQRWAAPGWRAASLLLLAGHFVLPFFFLLSRTVKRSGPLLGLGAAWLLCMHYVDYYWLVMPTLEHERLALSWVDATLPVGMGCVFVWRFLTVLGRGSVVARRDPYLGESMAFENT